jgi:hypothetical protein
MAVYLRMRQNPKIVFTSISQRTMEIVVLVLLVSFAALRDGATALAVANINNLTNAYRITSLIAWFIRLVAIIIIFRFGRLHFQTVVDLRNSLSDYDLTKSNVYNENDRQFLLGILNDLFTDFGDDGADDIGDHGGGSGSHKLESSGLPIRSEVHQHGDDFQAQQHVDSASNVPQADDVLNGRASVVSSHAEGIGKLNDLLRFHIPKQLPTQGLRSWALFRYVSAVVAFSYKDVVLFYDLWAWNDKGEFSYWSAKFAPYGGEYWYANANFDHPWRRVYPYENFLSVVGLMWQCFVLTPFGVWLLGALVRFLVWLHEWSRWPEWTAYAVFLPLLIVFESVLGYRVLFITNVEQLFWFLILPFDISNISPVKVNNPSDSGTSYVYDQEQYTKSVFRFQPLAGLNFLVDYYTEADNAGWVTPRPSIGTLEEGWTDKKPPPDWIIGYTAWFPTDTSLKILLWIFVIAPITILTWYVYEPSWFRTYRAIYWRKLWEKKSSDAENSTADGSTATSTSSHPKAPEPHTIGMKFDGGVAARESQDSPPDQI